MPPTQQNVPVPNPAPSSENAQSFKMYTGKAPVLVQLLAGLMWLGSLGLIFRGLIFLLLNPILGVLFLVMAGYYIYVGKLLFSMKKKAFKHGMILSGISVVAIILEAFLNSFDVLNVAALIVILAILFIYRGRMVN